MKIRFFLAFVLVVVIVAVVGVVTIVSLMPPPPPANVPLHEGRVLVSCDRSGDAQRPDAIKLKFNQPGKYSVSFEYNAQIESKYKHPLPAARIYEILEQTEERMTRSWIRDLLVKVKFNDQEQSVSCYTQGTD